jgi:hypothetical protein
MTCVCKRCMYAQLHAVQTRATSPVNGTQIRAASHQRSTYCTCRLCAALDLYEPHLSRNTSECLLYMLSFFSSAAVHVRRNRFASLLVAVLCDPLRLCMYCLRDSYSIAGALVACCHC